MWSTFVSLCLTLSGNTPRRPAPRRRPAFRRPLLEALEDRRLLSAGALDPTFGNGAGYVTTSPTNGADTAYSALIQPDGKLLAAGGGYIVNSKNVDTAEDFVAVRYNTNGSLDTSFGNGGTALANFGSINLHSSTSHPSVYAGYAVAALYPQAGTANDGKVVLAGPVESYNGKTFQTFLALARFNTNGTLDATFGNQGEVTTSFSIGTSLFRGGVVIQPDGKIVAAAGGSTGFELARYNPNGTLDSSFGSGGKEVTTLGQSQSYDEGGLLLQPDGKLIVSGDMDPSSGGHFWEIARYNSDGSLDTSFGSGGIVSGTFGAGADAYGSALYPSGTANAGKIVVVGGVSGGWGMARYNPDGSLDNTFGTGGEVIAATGFPWAVAIAADGKLVVAGHSSSFALFRYNADGSVDSTFGAGGSVTTAIGATATAVALQPNGDIVAVGLATGAKGERNFAVARYLPSEPEIGSFTASASTVTSGGSETLTASNIADANPGSTITQVAFYAQVNGSNTLLGYGTQTSPGVWTFTFTVSLAPGTYTLFAQAEDSFGVFGDLAPLTLTVQ